MSSTSDKGLYNDDRKFDMRKYDKQTFAVFTFNLCHRYTTYVVFKRQFLHKYLLFIYTVLSDRGGI